MLCLECDRDGAKAEAADLCGICFVEGLSEAPCAAVLPCKHVFHVECLADLLRARWSGPRISFGFLSCPNMACRGPFDSRCAALEPALAALRALRREVEGMALKRIEMEGLWPPKADSSGRGECWGLLGPPALCPCCCSACLLPRHHAPRGCLS